MAIRLLLVTVMIVHGTVHFLGAVKESTLLHSGHFDRGTCRLNGVFWMLSGSLFICAGILLFAQFGIWWVFSLPALVISEYLIINDWKDARFGTIANILIMAITLMGFLVWRLLSN